MALMQETMLAAVSSSCSRLVDTTPMRSGFLTPTGPAGEERHRRRVHAQEVLADPTQRCLAGRTHAGQFAERHPMDAQRCRDWVRLVPGTALGLPRNEPPNRPSEGCALAATVLVADDDADIRRFIEINLRLEGFEVVTAKDGPDALAKAIAVRPNLVAVRRADARHRRLYHLRADPR
jgi:CheY-like chemotaxis protein